MWSPLFTLELTFVSHGLSHTSRCRGHERGGHPAPRQPRRTEEHSELVGAHVEVGAEFRLQKII